MAHIVHWSITLLIIVIHVAASFSAPSIPEEQTPINRKIFTHNSYQRKDSTMDTTDPWSSFRKHFLNAMKLKHIKPVNKDRKVKQLNFHEDDDNDTETSIGGVNAGNLESDYIDLLGQESNIDVKQIPQATRQKRSFLSELFGYPSGHYHRRWWPARREGYHHHNHHHHHLEDDIGHRHNLEWF